MENVIGINGSIVQNGNEVQSNGFLLHQHQTHRQDEVREGTDGQPAIAHATTNGSTSTSNDRTFKPIAICGMACRLPGKVHNTQDLWQFLMSKSDARSVVPPTRYNIDGYYSSTKKPGAAISKYGYFLDESVDLRALDTSFFSLSRGEVERLDPQQRLLLEVARECLDDSGETGWKGKDIGVYVGSFGNDWYDATQSESQRYGMYQVSTTHDFALSNRLSYEMDLRGPSMTIRTACSSSLIGLNEACSAIAKGDCKSAIVCGTNIIMAPALTTDISEQGTLSPDGSCKTFSSAANGYARGEGVVAIYVKSLDDAIHDGNPIRAVIVGAATNCDGKTTGFSVPSATAQETLIRHTYDLAGIDKEDISKTGFFECHGTGTPVGDPIEVEAISKVFGDSGGVHIGSIKPNLGHGEGASGLTAVLKAVLALENRTIPPNIKSMPLNESIRLRCQNDRLEIPSDAIEWPSERLERVSVNSFGVGGANAHVIIDSAASFKASIPGKPKGVLSNAPQLLVYSAQTAQSLKDMTARYQKYLETLPKGLSLVDVAYTLANRREHLPFRSFTVGTKDQPGTASFQIQTPSTKPPSLVMVFTGQGSQWPQMGRNLFRTYPVFRETIQSLDHYLQELGEFSPQWKIEVELQKSTYSSRVNEAEFSQPLCTALQIALVDTLSSVGIAPAAVVGHSSGEIAAAYAAKAITAREAIVLASYRGLVSKKQNKPGAMAAVGLSWGEVEKYLVPGVERACDNSPNNVTLSGDPTLLHSVIAAIKKESPGVLATTLKVEKAYHSHHMKEIGEEYYAMMKAFGISDSRPSVAFFSSLTGELLAKKSTGKDSDHFGPRYWQNNLESPVLFNGAVSSILREISNPVFIEIGPHPALSGPLRQILTKHSSTALHIPTLLRRKHGVEEFLNAVGKLWALHIDVDLAKLIPDGTCLPDLPTYPWNHQRHHWFESRISKEWRMREYPHHDLLGVRVPESSGIEPVWRNLLHLDNTPWLRDHKVRKDIVFPLAGYIAIAAEGVRQISGIQESVELRKVKVSTALVLREEGPVEIVTNFRRHRLTETQDGTWWEFVVSSYNGHGWTKHCFGQVRASSKSSYGNVGIPEDKATPHKVHIQQWYERARRAGSGYGYHFTTLEELRTSASGTEGFATAKTRNNWHGDEANYHLHPVLVDSYLQLLCSAAHHGMRHGYRQLIPATVGFLAVSRCTADNLTLFASCKPLGDGDGFLGAGSCIADSKTVLHISDVSVFPLAENIDMEVDQETSITARSEWVPHIDFLNFRDMVKPVHDDSEYLSILDDFAEVVACLSKRLLSEDALEVPNTHILNYKKWIDNQATSSVDALDLLELRARMDEFLSKLAKTAAAPIATAMTKVHDNIVAIASGKRDASEVLNSGGTLDKVQTFLKEYDASAFFLCLGHTYPNLRVLEVGAGLGVATAGILDGLTHLSGQVLYSQYVYTDPLPGHLIAAKQRFKGRENLEFAPLDIDIDPEDQDFQDRKFDLIIATNLVHSKSRLRTNLKHLHKLLSPHGRLLLKQPRTDLAWAKYILGVLSDWWHGTENEIGDAHVSPEELKDELAAVGFQNSEDTEKTLVSTVVSVKPLLVNSASNAVTILCDTGDFEQLAELSKLLEERGFHISRCTLSEAPPAGQDIIVLLDQKSSFFAAIHQDSFESLKRFISTLDNQSAIFWVTKPSQIHCSDPSYGLPIGFARTIRSELALDFATCETDDLVSSNGARTLVDVFCKFHERDKEARIGPDFEYAIAAGVVRVNRFFPFPLENELRVEEPSEEAILKISRSGRPDSLYWAANPTSELKGDEVEVAVHAGGLNFRDVLIATGIIEASSDEPDFGYEAAGVVQRLGPDARNLSIGDRVLVISIGTFSTVITVSEKLCEKLPDVMSFLDGASMPIVFATAIYSLIDTARLQNGQSVLIHSGCGGVGLAAIQIARTLGAEIYTTVSNEEKASFLVQTLGIPRENIFNSRDSSFLDGLMSKTNRKGVDVALNSLSGELLHATWRCIAKWGMMVEIGKRDLIEGGKLDMDVFLANRSYCCVAIDQMRNDRPEVASRLLKTMMDFYRQGLIRPIRLAKVYPASAAPEAFKYMQQGSHIGKVVIALRENSTGRLDIGEVTRLNKSAIALDGAASYLLVGGLGGLGRAISIWMVQHGARNITILSRSAGRNSHDQDHKHLLESMGCAVQLVRGSVADAADVARAVEGTPVPLKGIIQMSMVLKDQAFPRMTLDDWVRATEPKVKGTWNLHEATLERGIELDFFLLFSSLSGILGQPGQANYAAANTFLDAFVLYRNHLGLPCSAIDVGAIEGAGYLFENEHLLKKMQGTGWRSVKEEELLEALGAALKRHKMPAQSETSPAILSDKNNMLLGISPTVPLNSPDCSPRLRKDIRMSVYHNMSSNHKIGKPSDSNDNLRKLLASAKTNVAILREPGTVTLLAVEIGRKLFTLLLKTEEEPDIALSLTDLGLDSMVAVEMRSWWKMVFGLDITVLDMMAMGTLEALAKRAAEELSAVYDR